jgi:NADPH-dependent 2,4-dienoyl-CoA reductase/sulfur reductase-like enzyme
MKDVVIIGGSLAGVRVAKSLRNLGFGGSVLLVSDEAELPYDRPPLSKELLTGKLERPPVLLSESEAEDLKIEFVREVRAEGIDPASRTVRLSTGQQISYGAAVVATGARPAPRPPEWEGACDLRTIDDSLRIREALAKTEPVGIVGAGFIGTEVASAAKVLGCDVTLIDLAPSPLSAKLGDGVADWFTGRLASSGIDLRLERRVERIEPQEDLVEITLDDGRPVRARVALSGIGVVPNDEWLHDSGVELGNGVLCDSSGHVNGVDDVYALGDVARWHVPRYDRHLRFEHWTTAIEQANVVARELALGTGSASLTAVPYAWSEILGHQIQMVGLTGSEYECRIVGDPDGSGRFACTYVDDAGVLRGAATVNWRAATVTCRQQLAGDASPQRLHEALTRLAG